jgi:HlyD family secretion protein
MWKRFGVAAAIVAVGGALVWASLASSQGRGKLVEVEAAGRRTVVAKVKASGTINPKVKVEIQSKVMGEIISLPVQEGDRVAAGQVVAEIEKALYVAARDQAKAALDQATVNLERTRAEAANATLTFERMQRLHAEGVASQEQLDAARLARESALVAVRAQEETIRQARSALQRAVEDLERTTIRSPIDGVVIALNVEKGETAIVGTMNFAGSVLMTIGDLSAMVAEIDVAESEVVSLSVGQEATVRLDAMPEVALAGRVVEIGCSGMRQGDVVKFRVKVALDNPGKDVRPGMTARVEVTTAVAANVVAVPQQAVQTRWLDTQGREVEFREGDASQREVKVVYTVAAGKAVRREVTVGVHDELWVEVREGLPEGSEVIVGPYRVLRQLKEGDLVKVAKGTEKGASSRRGEGEEARAH